MVQHLRRHLAIEGGVGAGKSTCLAALAAAFASDPTVVVLPEPVDSWRACGILQRMYDGTATALEFQLVAISTLAGPLVRALQGGEVRLVVSERSVQGNRAVFAAHRLSATDMATYDVVYSAMLDSLPPRDSFTLYLHAPASITSQRVAQRGRPEEAALPPSFHVGLHDRHLAYLASLDRHHGHGLVDAASGAAEVAGAVCAVAAALLRGEPPIVPGTVQAPAAAARAGRPSPPSPP